MTTFASFCSGAEMLGMGIEAVLGPLNHLWHAEIDPAASKVLAHRHPGVPNLGDITTVDWSTVPPVEVLAAGFPCTDVSGAGLRLGLREGTRTGIWLNIAVAIGVLRPRLVLLENVEGLHSARADSNVEPCPWCVGDDDEQPVLRASGAVLGHLADLGYDARWVTVPASGVGAPHRRKRVFIAAYPADAPCDARWIHHGDVVDAAGSAGRAGSVTLLPTPRVTDGTGPGVHGNGGMDLRTAVSLLPAPTVADARGTRNATAGRTPGAANNDGWTLSDIAFAERWGEYAPAIARWGEVVGRAAPEPTEVGTKGQPRLSPRFVEWMMGLPDGWVCDVADISRNDQLRILGNGVVWQQAAYAYRLLLSLDIAEVPA